MLPIPEALRKAGWRELLTGRQIDLNEDSVRPSDLFSDLPVIVLSFSNAH